MFKKEILIIFIGLCIATATLVLGWSVFVKIDDPVQVAVVDDGNDDIVDDDVPDDTEDDDVSEINTSDWKTYRNEEYGFEFKYPAEWGNLLESKGDFSDTSATHPSRIRISISNLKDNPVILEVDNGGDRMGRGKFTGDIVIDVDSQDYIKNFCQKNKNTNCEHKTNLNGINFVRYEDELCSAGGCFGKGLFYLMYNPNSEYRGILLYTYNIQKDKSALSSEEEIIFDSLVDSLKL